MSSNPPPGDNPYARRAIPWGRPPQTTFRTGPLPEGSKLLTPERPPGAPERLIPAPPKREAPASSQNQSQAPAQASLLTSPQTARPAPARAATNGAPSSIFGHSNLPSASTRPTPIRNVLGHGGASHQR